MTNSFQRWASDYAARSGFVITNKGNWVELRRGRNTYECMSVAGVRSACGGQ